MGDAEGGFIVLVHIPAGGGLSPYRDVYLVGSLTHEEAEAKIKDLYPLRARNTTVCVSTTRRRCEGPQIGTERNKVMAMTPKRPGDLNQLAKPDYRHSDGEKPDGDPTPEEQGKGSAAVALGKTGGAST